MPQVNQVISYNDIVSLTTTPQALFSAVVKDQEYNMLRVKNETGVDVILTFGESNTYIVKSGDDLIQPFLCSGYVRASVATGTAAGNLFVQLTMG